MLYLICLIFFILYCVYRFKYKGKNGFTWESHNVILSLCDYLWGLDLGASIIMFLNNNFNSFILMLLILITVAVTIIVNYKISVSDKSTDLLFILERFLIPVCLMLILFKVYLVIDVENILPF